jgi:sugar phosphate isomerase/epimerase
MDAGHAHLGGGDPAAFMAKYSKRIWGCHLKTFKGGQKNQVPLGQGDWGFEDLAAAVKKTGWTGWMLTEEGGSTSHPATDALGSDREYMRRLFGA